MTIFVGTSAADGSQDFLDALENRMGVTADVFRQYFNDFGQDGPNITTRGNNDAANGRISWISFKPPTASQLGITGGVNAALKAMTEVLNTGTSSALSAAKVQLVKDGFSKIRNGILNSKQRRWIITPFHEPENDSVSPSLFVTWFNACYDHLKPQLSGAGHETIIAHLLMAYTFNHPSAGRTPELYWSDKADAVLADSYGDRNNHNPKNAFDAIFAFCRRKNKELGRAMKVWIGETGDRDLVSTPAVDEQVKWVNDVWDYFKANKDVAGGFCYWEGGQRMSTDTEQAFAQIIKEARVFEKATPTDDSAEVAALKGQVSDLQQQVGSLTSTNAALSSQVTSAQSAQLVAEAETARIKGVVKNYNTASNRLASEGLS